MKKLLVWLASAFVCTAQAVSIGPFATETWVEDKIKEAESVTNGLASTAYVDETADSVRADIPDVSGFATVSQLNAVSNSIPSTNGLASVEQLNTVSNLIPRIDDLATIDQVTAVSNMIPDTSHFATMVWVGQEITNAVDDLVVEWDSVTNKPNLLTEESDPTIVLSNRTLFVRNDSIEIPSGGGGIAVEYDPVFTNWLSTTNIVWYSDPEVHGDGELHDKSGKRLRVVTVSEQDSPHSTEYALNLPSDGYWGWATLYYYKDSEYNRYLVTTDADKTTLYVRDDEYSFSDFLLGSFDDQDNLLIRYGQEEWNLGDYVKGTYEEGQVYLNVPGADDSVLVRTDFSDFVTQSDGSINVAGTDYNLSSFVTGSEGYITVDGSIYRMDGLVRGTSPGYSDNNEPLLHFSDSDNTYTLPTNWVEGAYYDDGDEFSHNIPELRFHDGYGDFVYFYPFTGSFNVNADRRWDSLDVVAAMVVDGPTNSTRVNLYPYAYTYFEEDHGELFLRNSALPDDSHAYDSYNLTHPEVDFIVITNGSNHAFSVPDGGASHYWYYLPTNAAAGPWVLARTNDIPSLDGVVRIETDPKWTQFKNDTQMGTYVTTFRGEPITNATVLSLLVSTYPGNDMNFKVGPGSLAVGESEAYAVSSFAQGSSIVSNAMYGVAMGPAAITTNDFAFTWTGNNLIYPTRYGSHGMGTFNVDPTGGASGFWIGETNLATYLQNAGGGGVATETDPKWTQFKNDAHINLHTNDRTQNPSYISTTVGLNISDAGTGSAAPGALAVGDSQVSSFLSLGAGQGIISNAVFGVGLGEYYRVTNSASFVWTGAGYYEGFGYSYGSHGVGTFNVDPIGGAEGFWIGETNLATYLSSESGYKDRIKTSNGLNEAYVNSSGVYYKYPDGYTLPVTLSFNAADDVHVGVETFPSNYTVVINAAVQGQMDPPIPAVLEGISTDGKWKLLTTNGSGYIYHVDGSSIYQIFRLEGLESNYFSITLDPDMPVVPDPVASLDRTMKYSSQKLATEYYVDSQVDLCAIPTIFQEDNAVQLRWGSGVYQEVYFPYYNDPSEFPQASQGAITTNGNGSVNVSRISSNSVSGNDNFVFGNSNSVFGDNVTVFGNGNLVTNSSGAAVLGPASHTVKDSAGSIVSGNGFNNLESSPYSIITGVGGTTAINSGSSFVLSGGGGGVNNSPNATFLAPMGTSVYDSQNIIIGGYHHNVVSNAPYSVVLGGTTVVTNSYVFMWNGGYGQYADHGPRTFNVNPADGTDGFYVGENSLTSLLALDAIAPAFLPDNVYTNGDYVMKDRHLYECTNYTGTAGWDANSWQQTSVTGILGNLRKILDEINGEAL